MDKEKVDEAFESLKAAITEGRELLQDMKAERQAFAKLLAEVRAESRDSVERRIDEQVKIGLRAYQATLERATKDATKAVFARFDSLADIMMGTDDPNKESLQVLVRRWRATGN